MRGRRPTKWSEKELEDYTLANLRRLIDVIHPSSYLESCWTLVGRQVRCHAGVIDALILCGRDLYVAEFKAAKASERVVGQLERYRTAIQRIQQRKSLDLGYAPNLAAAMQFGTARLSIRTLIVAPDFSKQVLGSADSCVKTRKLRGEFVYDRMEMPSCDPIQDRQLIAAIDPLYRALQI